MYPFKYTGGGFNPYDEDDDDEEYIGHSRHETLESRATFRILPPKKKGRKGTRSALRSQPESGSTSEAENTFEFSSGLRQFTTRSETAPAKTKTPDDNDKNVHRRGTLSYFDCDPTPTQARLDAFDALAALAVDVVPPSKNILDIHKDSIERAMSHITHTFGSKEDAMPGDDAFDSLDWDPDLPSIHRSESPEEVLIKPQPVTYTTVGSLVDPNAKPQFSAPRRIQREGAGRTPLISMLQGARFQPYFQPRGPPPSLNQSNSMAYAQHIGRGPNSAQSMFSHSARSTPSTEQIQMTELEKQILRTVQDPQDTQIMPGEMRRSDSASTMSSVTRLSAHAAPFNSRENSRRNTVDLFQELQKQEDFPKLPRRESAVKRYPLCKFPL